MNKELYSVTYEDYYGKEYNTAVHGDDKQDAEKTFRSSFKHMELIRQAIDDGYIRFHPYVLVGDIVNEQSINKT